MGTEVKVKLTQRLRNNLITAGVDPDDFATYFGAWKAFGAKGEYLDPYFGKDGFYAKPLRNNKMVLRHVHLPPEQDENEIVDWEKKAKRGSLKTSDNVLIYAEDKVHGYLLIYFVREPNGHSIAEMKTADSIKLMNEFCDTAEAFIQNGTILI